MFLYNGHLVCKRHNISGDDAYGVTTTGNTATEIIGKLAYLLIPRIRQLLTEKLKAVDLANGVSTADELDRMSVDGFSENWTIRVRYDTFSDSSLRWIVLDNTGDKHVFRLTNGEWHNV